jgi:hypothetical protein
LLNLFLFERKIISACKGSESDLGKLKKDSFKRNIIVVLDAAMAFFSSTERIY